MTTRTVSVSNLVQQGEALEARGETAKAETIYRKILERVPRQPHALQALGKLAHKQGRLDDAIAHFNAVLTDYPDTTAVLMQRGLAHAAAGDIDAARADFTRAIALAPHDPAAHHNFGSVLRKAGREAEACAYYAAADRLLPNDRRVMLNLATTLHEAGRMDDSLAAFERLVAAFPEDPYVRCNYGMALLAVGHFAEGWREYAWRDGRHDAHIHFKDFPYPRWAGEDFAGRDILVWTETGLGEEILTASMIPGAVSRARSVTVLCSDRAAALLRRSLPEAAVYVRAKTLPARAVEFQMSMSELGACLRQSDAGFPNRQRFLAVDEAERKRLRTKYRAQAAGRRLVGISWRSANAEVGAFKSTSLGAWEEILRKPGAQFVNLQYGDSHDEADAVAKALGVTIINDSEVDAVKDFAHGAAQVAAMDMVITVSNSTAHLAGGLGVPAWVMLPEGRARFWYWRLAHAYSPWYPSVRLFRQAPTGGWPAVIAACAAELQSMSSPL